MEHTLQKRSEQGRKSDSSFRSAVTPDVSMASQTGEYSADQLIHLQRTIGNSAVQRMLSTGKPVVQRILNTQQINNFKRFVKDRLDTFEFGEDVRVTGQKANWTAVKNALIAFDNNKGKVTVDNATITQAAGIIEKAKGRESKLLIQVDDTVVEVEAVAEETIPEDVDEAFDQFVVQEAGCSIDDVDDTEEWKRLIVNSLVKGEDSGGAIDFVTTGDKKKQITVSGVRHMTQKAANRSIWYKREGDHTIHLYALAQHIRGDNTKYRALSKTAGIHGSWTLVSNEAISGT